MEIYTYALKLLKTHDYTVSKLSEKLEAKFGAIPPEIIEMLLQKNFLNDRRFAENYIVRRKHRGRQQLRQELAARGIPGDLAAEILSEAAWPSLHEALTAKMMDWNLRAPLQSRDAGRLYRALLRLGYDEDAIRQEIENIHEQ